MLLFSGDANLPIVKNIATALGATLGLATISQYSDGESKIEIHQEVKDQDIFIIQPTSFPANANILKLLLLANSLRNKQARNITAVVPYFSYGRHDGDLNNGPNNAKLIMDLLVTSGVTRILTLDLHSERLYKTSNLALKNISAAPLFIEIPQIKQLPDPVIVSPDMGGIKRARKFAKLLGEKTTIAIIDKQRNNKNKATAVSIIGNVTNRNCIIVDDIIDTGTTLCAAATALKAQAAQRVYACCTHAVLSNNALQRLQRSACSQIFVTDSIDSTSYLSAITKLNYVSTAPLLAAAIANTINF